MKSVNLRRLSMILIAAAWAMLAIAWMCEASADEGTTMYVHVSDYLNARNKPSKDSSVEARFYPGESVEVFRIQDGWAQVEGGEAGTAWVSIGYLRDYGYGEDTPEYTVVSNGRVRIRTAMDGKVSGYAENGQSARVYFTFDGWAYLGKDSKGREKWIDSSYLQKNTVTE